MKRVPFLPLVLFVLTGCDYASRPHEPAPVEAVRQQEIPPAVEVVEVPTPLPLPGQLKPLPGTGEPELSPEEAVRRAREKALVEPDMDGFVNAIQVYPWTEGALYQVYAAPGRVTDLSLAPGERMVSLSAGDTVRWRVGETTSGDGEGERMHVQVKPLSPGLVTNLVIATDRRAYHLELRSTPETYMASVSWTYPADEIVALRKRSRDRADMAKATVARSIDPDELHFRYRIKGDEPPWRPLRAFDDGRTVYIQFPEGMQEAPPLFVVGADGETELVNYRVQGRYYVVDRLFTAAELRLGERSQTVVRIERVS